MVAADGTVGDITLGDEDEPRMRWPMAKVTTATPDTDGLVRDVKVIVGSKQLDKNGRSQAKRSELCRPIQKTVLLREAS